MGPVLILATLFSLDVKLAGTSGDILEEVEGMGCTMSGGLVIGSTGMVKGRSRCFWVECPCLQLEFGLPGPHCAWCHFLFVSHLLSHLSLAIGLTCKPCPVFCSC